MGLAWLGLFSSVTHARVAANPYLDRKTLECPAVAVVPPGNTEAFIPDLPNFTIGRLMLSRHPINVVLRDRTAVTGKIVELGLTVIPKVMAELRKYGLLAEALKVARLYDVDPVAVIGAVVGEQVFNSSLDRVLEDNLGNFYNSDFVRLSKILRTGAQLEPIQECMGSTELTNFWKWRCMNFYYSTIYGDPLSLKLKKASTCGIAQFNPVLVWAYNDLVVETSRLPVIEYGDLKASTKTVLTPKEILHYLGAYAKNIRKIYRELTCYDIGQNPGLTTTLYNIGNEDDKANLTRKLGRVPQVNYMGWFINHFESVIREELSY
jgi:hypothetical protein